MTRFSAAARPLFEMTASHGSQSDVLAHLRDTLLLKFLSGEIRVPRNDWSLMKRPPLTFHESVVEEAALGYFRELGYETKFGPRYRPRRGNARAPELGPRNLADRLKAAVDRINPHLSTDTREDAFRKVLRSENPSLVLSNRRFHELFTDGEGIETRREEGRIARDTAWLVDFEHPENNDWLVVNQYE